MAFSSRSQRSWDMKVLCKGQQDEPEADVPYCRIVVHILTVAAKWTVAWQHLKCFSSPYVHCLMSTLLAKDHVCVLSPTYTQFVLVAPPRTFPVVCITATQTFVVTEFPPSCSQRQSSNGDELRNKHPHVGPPVPRVSWHSITLEWAWRLTVKSPGGHHFQEQGQKPSVT